MSNAVGFFICYILVENIKKLIQLSFNQMKNQGNVINDASLISFPIVSKKMIFYYYYFTSISNYCLSFLLVV